jgi:hypothetical protein
VRHCILPRSVGNCGRLKAYTVHQSLRSRSGRSVPSSASCYSKVLSNHTQNFKDHHPSQIHYYVYRHSCQHATSFSPGRAFGSALLAMALVPPTFFFTQSTMRWTYSPFLDDHLVYLLQACKTTFFDHYLYIFSPMQPNTQPCRGRLDCGLTHDS